jgi:hypothetical protein
MNDWQLSLVRGVSAVVGAPMDSRSEMQQQGITREVDGAEFIRKSFAALRSRMNVTS